MRMNFDKFFTQFRYVRILTYAILGALIIGNPIFTSSAVYATGKAKASKLDLRFVSRLEGCDTGSISSEIAVYDPMTKTVLVTNGEDNAIDVFALNNDLELVECLQFDLTPYGAGVQSVAVKNGRAVAVVAADPVTDPGSAVFFDISVGPLNLTYVDGEQVGALPDMVTFNETGTHALVANEGEPRCIDTDPTNAINPEGSISIIPVNGTIGPVTTADFTSFNGQEAMLQANDVRVGTWPGASVAQDMEPEYITVKNGTAYVTLQENNSIAEVDIATSTITKIIGLGLKNHNRFRNRIDASNEDFAANLRRWPVHGMYMPDAIASWASKINGKHYIVTANEGDGREYFDNLENDEDISDAICFIDEARVKDITLDPSITAPGIDGDIQDDENLGRLKVSKFFPSEFLGGTPPTNDTDPSDVPGLSYSKLANYGGRSFTIWNQWGNKVWDSRALLASLVLNDIGADKWVFGPIIGTEYIEGDEGIDDRSDDKGIEPEAIEIGHAYDRDLLFVGLERAGGIMLFDVTHPRSPKFIEWQQSKDVAPEGIDFVSADVSPTGEPLVIVAYEETGSTVIWKVVTE